jgi:hypothetical protein
VIVPSRRRSLAPPPAYGPELPPGYYNRNRWFSTEPPATPKVELRSDGSVGIVVSRDPRVADQLGARIVLQVDPPQPTGNDELASVLEAGALLGAGMVPGGGEVLDAAILADPNSSWWDRGLAGLSLGANLATCGFLPNFGGFNRGRRVLSRSVPPTAAGRIHGIR